MVGIPAPTGILRKYLVRQAPAARALPVSHAEVEVELTYLLTADDSEARVRRRGQGGARVGKNVVRGTPFARFIAYNEDASQPLLRS